MIKLKIKEYQAKIKKMFSKLELAKAKMKVRPLIVQPAPEKLAFVNISAGRIPMQRRGHEITHRGVNPMSTNGVVRMEGFAKVGKVKPISKSKKIDIQDKKNSKPKKGKK